MTETRNMPSPEGRAAGEQLARLADRGEAILRPRFPDHAPRCQSCAFTAGTLPNGCLETVADAFKCLADGRAFYCHQHFDAAGDPTELCAGWSFALEVGLPTEVVELTKKWSYSGERAGESKP
jgi:hypothetical protein